MWECANAPPRPRCSIAPQAAAAHVLPDAPKAKAAPLDRLLFDGDKRGEVASENAAAAAVDSWLAKQAGLGPSFFVELRKVGNWRLMTFFVL